RIKSPLLVGAAVEARGANGRAVTGPTRLKCVSVHGIPQIVKARVAGWPDFPYLIVGSPRGKLNHTCLIVPVHIQHFSGFQIDNLVTARAIEPSLRARLVRS